MTFKIDSCSVFQNILFSKKLCEIVFQIFMTIFYSLIFLFENVAMKFCAFYFVTIILLQKIIYWSLLKRTFEIRIDFQS